MIVKVQQIFGSIEKARVYLLNLKNLEKNQKLGHVRYLNIDNVDDPVPELEALVALAPPGSKALVIVTMSLEEGEVFSSAQSDLALDLALEQLSETATIPVRPAKSSKDSGRKKARADRKSQKWRKDRMRAQMRRLKMIWPTHRDTPNQHAQTLICLMDTVTKELVRLNEGYDYYPWQYLVRAQEEWFQLHQNDKNFKPIRVVESDGIARFEDIPGREKRSELTSKHASAENHRGVESALRKLRKLHRDEQGKDVTPAHFQGWVEYGEVLKRNNACWVLYGDGARGFIGGYHAPMSDVNKAFTRKSLETAWGPVPGLPQIGLPIIDQRAQVKEEATLEKRLPAAAKAIACRAPGQALQTVEAELRKMPMSEFSVRAVSWDGIVHLRDAVVIDSLSEPLSGLVGLEASGHDIFFCPLPRPGQLVLPILEVKAEILPRLRQQYELAVIIQTAEDRFACFILVESLGDREKDATAARLLCYKIAKECAAGKVAVPGCGSPIPGLHQTATSGFPARLDAARDVVCQRATQALRECWRQREAFETKWWSGAAGQAVERLREVLPSSDPRVEIYRAHVGDMAETAPKRCHTLDMLNERIARRLLQSDLDTAEVEEVVATGAPLVLGLAHCNEWPAYARDRVQEARARAEGRETNLQWVRLNEAARTVAAEVARQEKRAADEEQRKVEEATRQLLAKLKSLEAPPVTPEALKAAKHRVYLARDLYDQLSNLPFDLCLDVRTRQGERLPLQTQDARGICHRVKTFLLDPALGQEFEFYCLPEPPAGAVLLTLPKLDERGYREFCQSHQPALAVRTEDHHYWVAVIAEAPRGNLLEALEALALSWRKKYRIAPGLERRFEPWPYPPIEGLSPDQRRKYEAMPRWIPPPIPLPGVRRIGASRSVELIEASRVACSRATEELRLILQERKAAEQVKAEQRASEQDQRDAAKKPLIRVPETKPEPAMTQTADPNRRITDQASVSEDKATVQPVPPTARANSEQEEKVLKRQEKRAAIAGSKLLREIMADSIARPNDRQEAEDEQTVAIYAAVWQRLLMAKETAKIDELRQWIKADVPAPAWLAPLQQQIIEEEYRAEPPRKKSRRKKRFRETPPERGPILGLG